MKSQPNVIKTSKRAAGEPPTSVPKIFGRVTWWPSYFSNWMSDKVLVSRSNSWSNYKIDPISTFWSSWYGQFLSYYDKIIEQNIEFTQNFVLMIDLVTAVIWFIKVETKRRLKSG